MPPRSRRLFCFVVLFSQATHVAWRRLTRRTFAVSVHYVGVGARSVGAVGDGGACLVPSPPFRLRSSVRSVVPSSFVAGGGGSLLVPGCARWLFAVVGVGVCLHVFPGVALAFWLVALFFFSLSLSSFFLAGAVAAVLSALQLAKRRLPPVGRAPPKIRGQCDAAPQAVSSSRASTGPAGGRPYLPALALTTFLGAVPRDQTQGALARARQEPYV